MATWSNFSILLYFQLHFKTVSIVYTFFYLCFKVNIYLIQSEKLKNQPIICFKLDHFSLDKDKRLFAENPDQVQYKKSKEVPKCTGLFLLD